MSNLVPTTQPSDGTRHAPRLAGGITDAQTWRTTLHLLLDLPVGTLTFSVMVTLLSVLFGVAITFVLAVPCLWLSLVASHAMGGMERARVRALLGVAIPAPRRDVPPGMRWWARVRYDVTRRSTWRELVYHLVLLPAGCVTFSAAVIVWTLPIALMALPMVVPRLKAREVVWVGVRIHDGTGTLVAGGVGFALLFSAPFVIHWLGELDLAMARGLLGAPRDEQLSERVQVLETSRSALVDAVDAERRRIERDLHDGAQQRLVSVAMDIGMAREKLLADPSVSPEVKTLLDSAHHDAKRAISELRDVARGVHPAILEDRGLDAALSSLAARCPVPVDLSIDVDERPPQSIEAAAYYVVAEALTNVAKHAHASKVRVAITRTGSRLGIEVTDDGVGGAVMGAGGGLGGGLAGLRDRVAAVDGWLQVLSPAGGPTTILAELPCAS